MVSAFLCQFHGSLRLPDDVSVLHPEVETDSTIIMHPVKDGYFTNKDLSEQTARMLKVFEILHPNSARI